jgi:hypothetical protein
VAVVKVQVQTGQQIRQSGIRASSSSAGTGINWSANTAVRDTGQWQYCRYRYKLDSKYGSQGYGTVAVVHVQVQTGEQIRQSGIRASGSSKGTGTNWTANTAVRDPGQWQ